MDSEDFLLKWNDHHTLFFRGAEELLEKDEYTDVILAAGSKFYSAHKLVLSICSPFFQNVFKQLGHHNQKTVIYMKDIEPENLELLLEYMYKGEIKVQENELVNVLSSAQSLEVRGLTDNSSSQSQDSKNTKSSNLKESKTQRVTSDLLPAPSGGGHKRSASNSSTSTSAAKRTKDTSPAKKSNYTAAAKSQKSPVVATSKGIKKEKTIATIKESRALNDAENISEEWPAVGEYVSGGEDSFVEDGANTTAGGGGVREKAASAVDTTEYDAYEHIGYEEDGEYLGDIAVPAGPVQIIPGTTDGEDREPETLSVKPDLGDLHEQLSMKPDLADLELTVKPDLTDLEPLRAGCPGSIPKYWCKFCGKSFEFPSALRKHIVVHTREKPWKCEFCGQAFSQKSSLPKHQRSSCKKLKDPANTTTNTTPIKAEQIDAECTPWLGGSSDTSNSGHAIAAGADTWTDPVKGHWLLDTANTDEDDDNSKSIHEDTPAPTPPIDTSAA